MIKIKNLTLIKNNKKILNNINIDLLPYKINVFVGNSGAGKSTLLKCIVQIDRDYEGEILFDNISLKDLKQKHKNILGFVDQKYSLFPHMTVIQNITHPIVKNLKVDKHIAYEKACDILKKLSIESLKNIYPNSLSGGQRQRVAIARSLVLNSKVLIFDEPTSALDPYNTKNLKILLKDLCDMGITIILSSHDIPFVKNLYNKIFFMELGSIVEFCSETDILSQKSEIYNFLNFV